MRRTAALGAAAMLAVTLLAGCGQGGNESTLEITGTTPAAPTTETSPTGSGSPSGSATDQPSGPPEVVDTIATGLEAPWGLDFLPSGDAIVTERDTRRVLLVGGDGRHEVTELGVIESAAPEGEAGLLGVEVSPGFGKDRTVYFYVTTEQDNRVVKATLRGGELSEPEPVLTGIPKGPTHDGGRLEFGPDGHLYVSTGETGEPQLAQDWDSLAGKVLRITPGGEPAPGNPFGTPVWTYGHRNVQGLAFDDDDKLWASEFGQDAFDELNLVEKDQNYGWPEVEGEGGGNEYVDPQLTWSTDEASPSGLAYLDSHLWMAALGGQRLWRVSVADGQASEPTAFFVGEYGRMRTIVAAPDGNLWVTTSNRDGRGDPVPQDDRILLVDPDGR